jgi:tRNA (guanine37-N1)-methyltransferase
MKIDIVTIFPEVFQIVLNNSIIKRAITKDKVSINLVDLRKYSHNIHHKIDDTIYGGASGMLMAFPPLYDCIEDLKTNDSFVILLTPQGKTLKQRLSNKLSKMKHLIIICGHYEGVDARILNFVDMEVSIGDFVLTGGELPAMVLLDSVVRLIPDVIAKDSAWTDSFQNNLLKEDEYTKPEEYKELRVPEVLLSGHHENIRKYNEFQSLKNTYLKRKDLLRNKKLSKDQINNLIIIKEEAKGKN